MAIAKPIILGNGILVEIDVVLSERVGRTGRITSSPIEGNLTVSDHFAREQTSISLTGICTTNGATKISNLSRLFSQGALCSYVGRNGMKDVVITKFDTDHGQDYQGGFSFSMTLTEVRISYTQEFTIATNVTAAQNAAQIQQTANIGVASVANVNSDAVTTTNTEARAASAVSTRN